MISEQMMVSDTQKSTPSFSHEMFLDCQAALMIVGDEYGATNGRQSSMTVTGDFATAIMTAHLDSEQGRMALGIHQQPVEIRRGAVLEIWCNGFYVEGSGVRRIVHSAVRTMLNMPEPTAEEKAKGLERAKASFRALEQTNETLKKVSEIARRANFTGIAAQLDLATNNGIVTRQLLKQAMYVASEECDPALMKLIDIESDKLDRAQVQLRQELVYPGA
jgi:hypothetical protein